MVASVPRPQFAHQFSDRVAQRLQIVEDRLPLAFVEFGFIKTAAHHVVKSVTARNRSALVSGVMFASKRLQA